MYKIIISLCISLLFLSSCAEKDLKGLSCPHIGILQNHNIISTNDYSAEFGDFSGKCIFKDGAVKVEGKIDIITKQNILANNSRTFEVFFALVDPGNQILQKNIAKVALEFEKDSHYAIAEELFKFKFNAKNQFNEQNYEILIGFQK